MSESARHRASATPPDPPADLPPPRDLGTPHRVLTEGVEPEQEKHSGDHERGERS